MSRHANPAGAGGHPRQRRRADRAHDHREGHPKHPRGLLAFRERHRPGLGRCGLHPSRRELGRSHGGWRPAGDDLRGRRRADRPRWSDKGRIRRAWQRIWTAIVWGQPAAFGASALTALAGGADWVATAYVLVVAAALGAAYFVRDNFLLSSASRFLGGASLLALAAVHSIVWSGQMADGIGSVIDAAIVTFAALMIVTAPALRHTRTLQGQHPGK